MKNQEVNTRVKSFLSDVPLFSALPEQDVDTLLKFSHLREYKKGEYLYRQNDEADRLSIVRNGWIRLYRGNADGEEGAIQLLYPHYGGASQEPVLAAVGELQFEVAQYRLKSEYGVETRLETLPYVAARWVGAGWAPLDGGLSYDTDIFRDRWGRPVLLFRSKWHLETVEQKETELKLQAVGL